jgi:hypothetical protein
LDQLHQTGVLGVLTNVVPMRPSQQKDGVVGVIQFLSVHKRIKIDETVSGTKRLVAKVSELQVILPTPLHLGCAAYRDAPHSSCLIHAMTSALRRTSPTIPRTRKSEASRPSWRPLSTASAQR